jgi:arylsulfatase A-like enzyme
MNIVAIVLDRLHAGYLGCYGNTWIATPAFDRLAAEGFLFQQAIIDSPDLADAYEAMWRGTHAAERGGEGGRASAPSLAELARRSGARTVLVTDDPAIANHRAAEAFDETVELDATDDDVSRDAEPAREVEKTHAARFFAEASEHVVTDQPFFVWLHTRGLGGAWDAPPAFRERYVDEDDPPAQTFTRLETRRLPPDVDLDERFGLAQAYAGQVTLTDVCLGGLLAHLDETGLADNTAVLIISPRGIGLGEHDDVGTSDRRLNAEIVQVPWLLRLPKSYGKLRRPQALVQPCDVYHTLAELLGAAAPAEGWGRSVIPLCTGRPTWRDRALVGGRNSVGIRTAGWYRLEGRRTAAEGSASAEGAATAEGSPGDEAALAPQLFAKPDDWWEVNNVAGRCPEIVDRLGEVRRQTAEALAAGKPVESLAGDDQLVTGMT